MSEQLNACRPTNAEPWSHGSAAGAIQNSGQQPANAVDATPAHIDVRGATAIIPQKMITDGEVVILAVKPSLWLIPLASGRWLLTAGLAVVTAHLLGPMIGRLAQWTTQIAVLAATARLLIATMEWLGRVYVLTDRRIMRLKGVVHIDLFECQLSRVQHVVLRLPIAERAVFCGTLFFFTAGTGSAEAAWRTVAHPSAVYQTVLETIEKYTRQRE